MAGKQLWHTDLGPLDKNWGTAASPMLYKNCVIQLCDSPSTRTWRPSIATAAGLWRTERVSDGCWTTPVLLDASTEHGPRAN